jgi:hypothetical protein
MEQAMVRRSASRVPSSSRLRVASSRSARRLDKCRRNSPCRWHHARSKPPRDWRAAKRTRLLLQVQEPKTEVPQPLPFSIRSARRNALSLTHFHEGEAPAGRKKHARKDGQKAECSFAASKIPHSGNTSRIGVHDRIGRRVSSRTRSRCAIAKTLCPGPRHQML